MDSEKRGRPQHGAVAGRGPRPVVTGPGSINRGFESVDPERQREPGAQDGSAVDKGGTVPDSAARTARVRRAPATGGTAPPRRAGSGRAEPDEGGSG